MCRAVEVSKSGYYAFKRRPKSQNRIENERLLIEINRVYFENDRNYGSPRIWDHLRNKEQMRCSENRVARVMRINGVVAIQKRRFRVTTNSKHDYPVWPDLVNRSFNV
jgi:transposase InsO family protein